MSLLKIKLNPVLFAIYIWIISSFLGGLFYCSFNSMSESPGAASFGYISLIWLYSLIYSIPAALLLIPIIYFAGRLASHIFIRSIIICIASWIICVLTIWYFFNLTGGKVLLLDPDMLSLFGAYFLSLALAILSGPFVFKSKSTEVVPAEVIDNITFQ